MVESIFRVRCGLHEASSSGSRSSVEQKRYSSIVESKSFKRNLGFDPQSTEEMSGNCGGLFAAPFLRGSGPASREVGCGQATKGARWMPRHQKTMKDVVNCEMLRGVVRERRSVDVRMGKPGRRNGLSSCTEYIGAGSQPGEVKHLSTRRKRNQLRLR